MRSAVVLAGYNNKRTVEKYSKTVSEHYGEKFIETGYKPLREFSYNDSGQIVAKPLILFTLEELFDDELISDIVIVGHRLLLEKALLPFLKKQNKEWSILDQNESICESLLNVVSIDPKLTPLDSIAANIIKGYGAAKAYNRKEHALFVASDSPFTDKNFINHFLQISDVYLKTSYKDVIFPAVPIGLKKDAMGRVPFLMKNDTGIDVDSPIDRFGRTGFRLSSLILANPLNIDVNRINSVYSLRKAISPKVQIEIFRITRELGYQDIYSKYFLRKDLSITECENIMGAFLKAKVGGIPLAGIETTFDYDGTESELKKIREMIINRKV